MKKFAVILLSFVWLAGKTPLSAQAPASEKLEVMSPINLFLEGFNTGDPKKMLAAGTEKMSIIDEVNHFRVEANELQSKPKHFHQIAACDERPRPRRIPPPIPPQ